MINLNSLNKLFKPRKQVKSFNIADYIIEKVGLKKFWKIQFESECSKSIDESCINSQCQFNYLHLHENELYIEIMQEIQHERKELEKRVERDRKKYGYM